jgi:DNA polymerase-3 subunit beta
MKTSCLLSNLDRALSIVGRAVATRSTLPVLSNILLATENGRLKLSATNLEIGITCWIGAKVDEDGAVTVPARTLVDLVGVLPDERVDMSLDDRTQTLNLKCGRFTSNLRGIDASEFPAFPSTDDANVARIDPEVLRSAINQVVFAARAATEESRPILTGVFAQFANDSSGVGQVTLAAADGFRLAVRSAPLLDPIATSSSGVGYNAIIPARALGELSRILGGQRNPIAISITPSKSHVLFHLDDVDLVSQLIDGNYPDYNAIVPRKKEGRVVVNTSEMLKACKAASVFARESQNTVKLSITPGAPGQIVVRSTSAETGDNVGQVDATVEGEPIEIAFNVKYLVDVLAAVRTDQIAIETTTPSSPGKFMPMNDGKLTCVVMPMHLGK